MKLHLGDRLDREGEEFIAFAVDGAGRVRELIEGLLEYSRASYKQFLPKTTDLQTVLDAALANLQVALSGGASTDGFDSSARLTGGAALHYDLALRQTTVGPSHLEVRSWQRF